MSEPRAVTPAPSSRDYWIGVAAAFATVAIWAAWPVITRYGVTGSLSPAAIGVLRFLPPALLLAPVWWRIGLFPKGMSWKVMLALSCGGLPFFIGSTAGFQYASVATSGSMLLGSTALLVAIIGVAVFRTRIDRSRLLGYGLIAAAVVLSLIHALLVGEKNVLLGSVLFLCSALSWAIYTVAFPLSRLSGIQAAALVSTWALIIIFPFGAMEVVAAVRKGLYADIALQLVQQGLLSAILAIWTYSIAITRIGPARAATLVTLTPLIAAVAAYFVLGEVPEMTVMIALGLASAGVVLASRMPKSAPRLEHGPI